MKKRSVVLAAAAVTLGYAGLTLADFPLMNMVADKVIQKYQSVQLRAALGAEAAAQVRSRSSASWACSRATRSCAPRS